MIPRDNPFDPFDRTVRQMIGQLSELDSQTRVQSIPYANQYIDDNQLEDVEDIRRESIEHLESFNDINDNTIDVIRNKI